MTLFADAVRRLIDLVSGLLLLALGGNAARRGTARGLLSGRYTLVGPRLPQTPDARPGLLCLWWLQQRSNIDYGSEAAADARYLAQRSLKGDFAIVLRAGLSSLHGAPVNSHEASVQIAGLRLLNLEMQDMLNAIDAALRARQPMRIAFVNPDCVNLAAGDAAYRACLEASDWVCADGIGMKIAGKLLQRPIRQNINGTDLFPLLCAQLAQRGQRLFLLGGQDGVAAATAAWAQAQFPGLQIAGTANGYFTEADTPALLRVIRAARADVLLVALGAPRQEKWLAQHHAASGATLGMGVGGLFDYYSGRIPRAPQWLREIGGEWVFRLLQEPGRLWRRYLIGNGVFLLRILREKYAAPGRKNRKDADDLR